MTTIRIITLTIYRKTKEENMSVCSNTKGQFFFGALYDYLSFIHHKIIVDVLCALYTYTFYVLKIEIGVKKNFGVDDAFCKHNLLLVWSRTQFNTVNHYGYIIPTCIETWGNGWFIIVSLSVVMKKTLKMFPNIIEFDCHSNTKKKKKRTNTYFGALDENQWLFMNYLFFLWWDMGTFLENTKIL